MTHIRALVPVHVKVGLRGALRPARPAGAPLSNFEGVVRSPIPVSRPLRSSSALCMPPNPVPPDAGVASGLFRRQPRGEPIRFAGPKDIRPGISRPGSCRSLPALSPGPRRLCGENSLQFPASVLPCLPASFSRLIYFPNKIVIVPLKLFDTTTSSFPSPFKSATANPDQPISFKLRDEI